MKNTEYGIDIMKIMYDDDQESVKISSFHSLPDRELNQNE